MEVHTTRVPSKVLQCIYLFQEHNHWPTSQLFHISNFLSLQEAIDKRREEIIVAAFQTLPVEEEEETVREVIPSEGDGDSPACQSLEEALFS